MNLSKNNFFGHQHYTGRFTEYPPHTTDVKCVRYGYESGSTIYDVVIPERPIMPNNITRFYKTNGVTSLNPTKFHIAVEQYYNL